MKKLRHLLLIAASACGLFAYAQDGMRVESPYALDFETSVSTSGTFSLAKSWTTLGTGSTTFRFDTGKGVDASKALFCGYQSASTPKYLITPRLTGEASLMVKNYNASTSVVFRKVSTNEAGEYVIGDTIPATVDGEPNTSTFVKYAISGLQNERVAIYAHYAYIDNFAASSAEIDLYKSLKVFKCTTTSPANPDCNAQGYFTVDISGQIINTGDLEFKPGDTGFSYSIGKYNSSSTPHKILVTEPFDEALAPGDTATVLLSVTLSIADYPSRYRYDLLENFSGTYAAGSWVEPVKYEPVIRLRNSNNYSMTEGDSYEKEFGTFGMIAADVARTFTIENAGAAPLEATISVPEGFSVSKSEVSIAAHESETITLTALSAVPGIYTGNLSISAVGYDAISRNVPLSVTVRDAAKFFEDFEANADVTSLPKGWFECALAGKWDKTSYTNGANNFAKNSNSTEPSILCTPKLRVEEGEKLSFDAARRSTSTYTTCTVDVYYSTDRINWVLANTDVIDITGTNSGTSATATQSWSNHVLSNIPAGEYYIGFKSGYAAIDNVYGFTRVDVAHDVAEIEAKIPASAMVNNEYTATYKVYNIGDATEEAYTASLVFNGEEVCTIDPADIQPIAASSNVEYAFSFTPHYVGTYPAYVKLSWADGYEVVSNTVDVVVGEERATNTYTVGTTTSYGSSPLYLNYYNSVSETLYTAEMLAAAGIKAGDKISSITYAGFKTSDDHTGHVKLFIANGTDTEFGTIAFTADDAMTLVFEGDHEFKKQGNTDEPVNDYLSLSFSEPFVYTGGSLRVKIQSEAPEYKSVYFATDSSLKNLCYGGRHDGIKVANLKPSNAAWYFPVTQFGIVLTPATFKGTVVDQNNNPVEGVSVVLTQVPAASEAPKFGLSKAAVARYEGTTNAEGVFEIPVIQSTNTYSVTFSKAGYVTYETTISEITEIGNVVLEKETPTAVTDITVSKALDSNVYTIDGRIVRRNAESLEGLSQGIYIFQGKKHIVK
ncbi:MAG: carboxypeptidase regulatory-like domain-containing protein [Sodaliphilus sp.]|nr:carboxypeptidase regulatory-like domain-containing protein [Sodaliphilus sp.]